jgi:predicted phage terminase large subunit-like protein
LKITRRPAWSLPQTLSVRRSTRAENLPERGRGDLRADELPVFQDAASAAASFREFIRQAWPILNPGVPLEWGWHIDAIVDHLMALSSGEILNLIITVPPGTTKTTIVSIMWPSWAWLSKPWLRWLCAANEDGLVMVIDPATGKGATGDLTAVGVFAVHVETRRVLVLDMISRRMPIAGSADGVEDLMTLVRRLARQWGCDFAAVEADGFQSSVAEKVEALGLTVHEVSHENRGKLTRAQSAIIAAEAGDVWISPDADWVAPFLDELCAFTGLGSAEVDNQVDVLSYAMAEAARIVPDGSDAPFSFGQRNTWYNRRG